MENRETSETCTHRDFHVFKDKENNGDITYIGVCFTCGLSCELRDRQGQEVN